MNILQFKRGNSDSDSKRTDLQSGELYVNTSNESVWVGKDSGQFQIKSKPVLGVDIVNANNTVISKLVKDFTITSTGTGGASVVNITYSDDSTAQRNITISGTVANAANATNSQYARYIGTSASHPAIGSTTKPVYVNSSGQISVLSPDYNIGSGSLPVYYNKTTGFTPVDTLQNLVYTTKKITNANNGIILVTSTYGSGVYVVGFGAVGNTSDPLSSNLLHSVVICIDVDANECWSSSSFGNYIKVTKESSSNCRWKIYTNDGSDPVTGQIFYIYRICK